MSSQAKTGLKILLYLGIVAQFVATSLSLLLIFALTIPLYTQLKNGTFRRSVTQSRRRDQVPTYSTYNLYLVYLALLDLSYLIPVIAAEFCNFTPNVCSPRVWSSRVEMAYPPPPDSFVGMDMEDMLGVPYGLGNFWINAVIAYEVWLLLKATRLGRRITQPSLKRVNLQCGGVIFGSIGVGVFMNYMLSTAESWDSSDPYFRICLAVLLFVAVPPPIYATGVTIFVKCRGYMPLANGSTPRDRAVRGLALYFFRVAIVFVSIWIPCLVIVGLTGHWGQGSLREYICLVHSLLYAFQPILTFWMILNKPDVNRYIKDFTSLFYLPESCTCCKRDGTTDRAEDLETADEQTRRKRGTIQVLGYNFEGDGADGDADGANGDTVVSNAAKEDAEEQGDDVENNVSVGDSNDDGGKNENDDQIADALDVAGGDSDEILSVFFAVGK